MSGRMKVWVVKHPHGGRQWCRARVWQAGESDARTGFVLAEWDGPCEELDDDGIVPHVPDRRDYRISNVDPLVFGPRMYFDYCRKDRFRPPNELERGDLVLFASRNNHQIVVDTVFVVGDVRRWPTLPGAIPSWPSLGPIAERVHYHPHALWQHPRIHDDKLAARSYRGASYEPGGAPYCWVPWRRERPGSPFTVPAVSEAFAALQSIYPGKILLNGLSAGSFGVASCETDRGRKLFDALLHLARAQGFGVATRIEPESEQEVPYAGGRFGCQSKRCGRRRSRRHGGHVVRSGDRSCRAST